MSLELGRLDEVNAAPEYWYTLTFHFISVTFLLSAVRASSLSARKANAYLAPIASSQSFW